MRTTLTVDDDVLFAAKEIAAAEGRTTGAVISDFFRRGMERTRSSADASANNDQLSAMGIQRLRSRGTIVSNEDVNRIREELGV